MAPQLIFSEEELAVTTPRQLAPTVGQVRKGVEIVGEARRGMEKLAIGRLYTNQLGETEIDDLGWSSEMDEVDEGYQFIFGKINVFIGMVNESGKRIEELDSVSEATIMVESEGEESVGTSEIEIVAEQEEQQIPIKELEKLSESGSEPDYDVDSESILPLFEDRLGLGVEEEDYVQSPARPCHVGVYMSLQEICQLVTFC